MEKMISVIIPVYNVALYLEECLNSVVSQSYTNLEIILIDDGSTDHSGTICDQFANSDNRIKVIHQKNAGAAAAKNAGLRVATGAYLSFVDSDDYLEPGAFQLMANFLEKYDADVVQCAYRDLFTDGSFSTVNRNTTEIYTAEEYLLRYTTDWTSCLLWDKLYKRTLFEGVFFEEGHIIDDEFFTYQGIMNAQRVVYTPEIIYYYRKRKSSVTARPEYRERTIMDKLDYLSQRRIAVRQRFPGLMHAFDEHYLNMLLWLSVDAYTTERCLSRIKGMLKTYLAETGHTAPGFRQQIAILRVLMSPARVLLRKRSAPVCDDISRYFN